ncbi:MAG TPA: SsrA-binding protein [Parachlamydiales bacterium]|nr:SsrA-binding protein [Parachlamydiales bacterium]
MAKTNESDLVSNRRATHDYEVLDTWEAGIVLLGTEIKSLRNHGGSLQDAFIDVRGAEAWLLQASIAPYGFGNIHNHEERRPRKLLLHKREFEKIRRQSLEKGLAIIPLSIYLKKGIAKVKIALAKGKKLHDKRGSLKAKEDTRAMDRARKGSYDS